MPNIQIDDGTSFTAPEGHNLLEACEAAGIEIEAACGGFAACNTCRVRVIHGMDQLSEKLPEEEGFLDREDQRLACQCEVRGDVTLVLDPGE